MMNDYEAVQRNVVQRLRGRIMFYAHAAVFALLFFVVMSAAYWHPNKADGFFLWGAVLLLHAARTFRWWDRWVHRLVMREYTPTPLRLESVVEKPKRGVFLSNDGELEYIEEELPTKQKLGEKS
ncbi:MAG: hypothetical protein OHK0023_12070 [Anaerolineae bacterium]